MVLTDFDNIMLLGKRPIAFVGDLAFIATGFLACDVDLLSDCFDDGRPCFGDDKILYVFFAVLGFPKDSFEPFADGTLALL